MRSRGALFLFRTLALAGTAALAAYVIAASARLTDTEAVPASSISPDNGFAYLAGAPGRYPRTPDSGAAPGASPLELLEDGRPLGPAHSIHEEIRKLGHGRYSDWSDGNLRFSASDNSDPRTNGRAYTVRYPVPRGSEVVVPLSRGIIGLAAAAGVVMAVMCAVAGRGPAPAADGERQPGGGRSRWAADLGGFLGLTLLYVAALILILAAYRAQQRTAAGFRINFEYKVF